MKMVIEGDVPIESLQSKQNLSKIADSKKPFSFKERTWELPTPTEEEVSVCVESVESMSTKTCIVQYTCCVVFERVKMTAFCMSSARDP